MYNRYIPQADGSFRRNRVPEPAQARTEPPKAPPTAQNLAAQNSVSHEPQQSSSFPPSQRNSFHMPRSAPVRNLPQYDHSPASVGSFLKGLLPQNFDTEDLMVVLLLLLMSGNSGNDQNSALMTLVIYLFL